MNVRATSDRYSLENLALIITAPNASEEEKRLALSVAYENGKRDALNAVKEKLEELPW